MLGIDPAVLRNVPNARGTDQMEAAAMNSALFPATLGYFMEEMMHPEFSETDIEATRQFFTGFVSGGTGTRDTDRQATLRHTAGIGLVQNDFL